MINALVLTKNIVKGNKLNNHPKLIEVLVNQTPRTMVALLIASSAYFWIFISFIPFEILSVWLFCQSVLAVYRFYNAAMLKKYLKLSNTQEIQKHKKYFIFASLAQALIWTASSILVVIYAPQPFELVNLLVILGVITAGALSMSTLFNAYLMFFFTLLIPQIVILLYYGEPQHTGLVVLILVYIPAIIMLSKTIYNSHVMNIKTNARLEENVKELDRISMTDYLTNIYNRRYFFKMAQHFVSIATREKKDISLLMIDIDFFKNINDTYGHDAGDFILINLVNQINEMMRKSDVFARIGGEEFSILLNNTSIEGAAVIAEKIRTTIENKTFKYKATAIKVTVSIGISTLTSKKTSIDALYKQADKQLYSAKENGRNRVVS